MTVSHKDIEAKLREIQSEVSDAGETAKPAGIALGTLLAFGSIGIAYIMGQRKTNQQTTIVEVRRQ